MEIPWALVEHKAAEFVHGEPVARPDLRDAKRVKSKNVRISLFRLHDLDFGSPLDLLTILDGVPKVTLRVVRITPEILVAPARPNCFCP